MGYEYEKDIVPYVIKADQLIKTIIFNMSPLYKKEHGEGQDVTVPLFATLHSTSESILILLLHRGVFDADVLLRTVMEGTIKYCYLMTGTYETRKERYREYRIDLAQIEKLEDHKKAIESVEILKEFSNNNTKPFEVSILSEEENDLLSATYPKQKKNDLKRRWGYSALLRELAKDNKEYEAQLGSLSTYALSSHFCHFDWTGVSSRNTQSLSSEENSDLLDFGHALRIISNVLSCYLFRVAEYIRGNSFSSAEVSVIALEAYDFIKEIDKMQNKIIEERV